MAVTISSKRRVESSVQAVETMMRLIDAQFGADEREELAAVEEYDWLELDIDPRYESSN